jgi:hypothetical protein
MVAFLINPSYLQMLLLPTFMEFDFNKAAALTELSFVEPDRILDTSRFVIFP